MSWMHSTAAGATEPEKLASSKSGEVRELKEQLATLVGVVERQSNVALLQAEALRRQDEEIKRLENLLIQQTGVLRHSRRLTHWELLFNSSHALFVVVFTEPSTAGKARIPGEGSATS
uniref:Uncharacterized protein n=1 Tax=Ananas comosus var. bracteatus TaxID=296719 RepID=A0A6V7QHM9_ANACO|nr:unnamed protein product [Ananas comosus var. bracteatus]